MPKLQQVFPQLLANDIIGVQPLSEPLGIKTKYYSMSMSKAVQLVTYVTPAKPLLESYQDGSYVELILSGATSPYPIYGRVNYANGTIDFVNFSYETRSTLPTAQTFNVIRSEVDIERHRTEKPHWFI